MTNLFLVGIGGVCGAFLRYFLGIYISRRYRGGFPLATLIINISGSFILAFLASYIPFKNNLYYHSVGTFLMTGVLGAYTTFSTFSIESLQLLEDKDYSHLITYVLGTLILGLVAALLGAYTARII